MTHPFGQLGGMIIGALGAPAAISVTRYAPGVFNDATGRWVHGGTSILVLDAVVQPSTPREIRQLPEGERTTEAITVWTVAPLLTSRVDSSREADVISWDGRTWKVVLVEDWTVQAGYARAVAVRIGP